jgi:hypothetical protein
MLAPMDTAAIRYGELRPVRGANHSDKWLGVGGREWADGACGWRPR